MKKKMNLPVHIFVWGDGVGDGFTVNLVNRVQRQLNDQPMDSLVFVNGHYVLQDLQDERKQEKVRGEPPLHLVRGVVIDLILCR